MNQTFSLPRFGRLLRKYFTDNRGQLGINVALLAVVLIALACIFYSDTPSAVDRNRSIPFFFVGWVAWYIFIWQQAEPLNNKERALTYLMQPASQMEKIVLIWFVSGIGFMLAFLLVFGLIDAVGVQYVNSREWPQGAPKLGSYYEFKGPVPPIMWAFTALLHPIALALLLVVRKYALPSVAVLVFVLLFGGLVINSIILGSLTGLGETQRTFPFGSFIAFSLSNKSQYRRIDLPQPIGDQLRYVVGITLVVLLYITAYFRLNEREV